MNVKDELLAALADLRAALETPTLTPLRRKQALTTLDHAVECVGKLTVARPRKVVEPTIEQVSGAIDFDAAGLETPGA